MPGKTAIAEAVAAIRIDIGKNTFHLIGLEQYWRDCYATEAVARPSRGLPRQHAAVPDRHGSLRRGTSSEPTTQGARP